MPFVTMWMDFEGVMLSEMSDRERQILYDPTYMGNLKKITKLTETEGRLVVARGG